MAQSEISAQSIFDKTVTHLFNQTARSEIRLGNGRHMCVYRGHNGNKCAVGIHIPDDVYEIEMDGNPSEGGVGARTLAERYPSLSHLVSHIELLIPLQAIHDDCERNAQGREEMYDDLLSLADAKNLDTTILNQFAPDDNQDA